MNEKIQRINNLIKQTLQDNNVLFEVDTDSQNHQILIYSFSMGTKNFFPMKMMYDDASDSILIAVRSNTELKNIPEYDILQWINEKNSSLPLGCFTHYLENGYVYLHHRIGMNILDMLLSQNKSDRQTLSDENLLIVTAFNLVVIMEEEEENLKLI